MKDAKMSEVLNGWFWSWLAIAAALVVGMILLPSQKEVLASVILFLFCLMPFRNALYRLIVWLIDYRCSNDDKLKKRLNAHATINTFANPKERVMNTGFYREIWCAILVSSLILGLLWMVFRNTSFQVVYAWVRSIEFLVTLKYSALAMLILVIVKCVYYYGVVWAWGVILNDQMFDKETGKFSWKDASWRLLIMVVGYYANILLSALLLKYSLSMTLASLGYKTCLLLFGVPTLYLLIWRIGRLLFPAEATETEDEGDEDEYFDDEF